MQSYCLILWKCIIACNQFFNPLEKVTIAVTPVQIQGYFYFLQLDVNNSCAIIMSNQVQKMICHHA